jgi:hypothetical protein
MHKIHIFLVLSNVHVVYQTRGEMHIFQTKWKEAIEFFLEKH